MNKMISYLKFLLKSTNQHGVHSPFVFDYVTKCLYTKPKLSKNNFENVLFKSISYFDSKNIYCKGEKLIGKLKGPSSKVTMNNPPYDLIVIKQLEEKKLLEIITSNQVHNDSMFLVHPLQNNWSVWKEIIQYPEITVSIDSFHLGMLFIRKEQEKEHFIIRL